MVITHSAQVHRLAIFVALGRHQGNLLHLADGASSVLLDTAILNFADNQAVSLNTGFSLGQDDLCAVGNGRGRLDRRLAMMRLGRSDASETTGAVGDDGDREGRPGRVLGTELAVLDRHILCADGLGVDAVEERDQGAGKDAGGDVAGLGGLLGWLGDDGDGGAVKDGIGSGEVGNIDDTFLGIGTSRSSDEAVGQTGTVVDLQLQLERFRLGSASHVQIAEGARAIILQRRPLAQRAVVVARLANHRHRHLGTTAQRRVGPIVRGLDVDNRRRAKEPLLRSIRFLSDRGVQAADGRHLVTCRGILGFKDLTRQNSSTLGISASRRGH